MVQISIEEARSLWNSRPHGQTSFDAVFCKDSSYKNIETIKTFIGTYLLEERCSVCGISSWNGLPLNLHLDHISGDHRDHSLNNIRLLCPNCHSQTETYCRGSSPRKPKAKDTPSIPKEAFLQELSTKPNIRQALISLGLQPHGANYSRAYDIAVEAGITLASVPITLKKPPKEDLEKSLIEHGCTAKMAQCFRVSRSTIQEWLKGYNIPHSRNRLDAIAIKEGRASLTSLPPLEDILSSLKKAGSISLCAIHLGINTKRLRKILEENKDSWIPIKAEMAATRQAHKVEHPRKEELQELITKGVPFLQLGKRYGVSDNAVRKWAISYGIIPRNKTTRK
ncbi:MAG: HNH endonuclease signature motif containing protein [Candidatus Neomarinimicrobiota bacterium]|jgi:transposase